MTIFIFFAYFSSGNYLWLRNLFHHDPKLSSDPWFLGAFTQVLIGNHFNSSWECISLTDESLTKIFHWDNRIEEHMGHLDPRKSGESETPNMIMNH